MIIAITNNKGWVGKSTICQNLAVCFAYDNKKVCIVDVDTNQVSLSWYWLRSEALPTVPVYYAPNERVLRWLLREISMLYDIVLLDGVSSNFALNKEVIKQAKILLIPILPSKIDFQVTKTFVEDIQKVQIHLENFLLVRFLVNQMNSSNLGRELGIWLGNLYYPKLHTYIKSMVGYKSAYEQGRGVVELANKFQKQQMEDVYKEVSQLIEKANIFEALRDF